MRKNECGDVMWYHHFFETVVESFFIHQLKSLGVLAFYLFIQMEIDAITLEAIPSQFKVYLRDESRDGRKAWDARGLAAMVRAGNRRHPLTRRPLTEAELFRIRKLARQVKVYVWREDGDGWNETVSVPDTTPIGNIVKDFGGSRRVWINRAIVSRRMLNMPIRSFVIGGGEHEEEEGEAIVSTDPTATVHFLLMRSPRVGLRALKHFADHGADFERRNKSGHSALGLAIAYQPLSVVSWMLEKVDGRVDSLTHDTMRMAITRRTHAFVDLMLRHGFPLDSELRFTAFGYSTLMYAVILGSSHRTVQTLLDHGADVSGVHSDRGESLLVRAACRTDTRVLCSLLDTGKLDIDAVDSSLSTPLVHASQMGHLRAVEELLERGASLEATDGYGRTPLYMAARNRRAEVVRLLLSRGAVPDACGNSEIRSYIRSFL